MRSEPVVVLALWLAAAGAARGERIEAVMASVDGRPVLLSELRAVAGVKGVSDTAAREALVDQFLMEREALRFPALAPTADAVERLAASLVVRAPGVPLAALRRLARREALILAYVEFRFRPLVQADETELQGDWLALPEPRPPFAEVHAELQQARVRRQLDVRLETWVTELRRGARIRYPSGG